jgi:hypothetical protein
MRAAVSPASGRPYGLAAVCRVWRIAVRASIAISGPRHRRLRDGVDRGPVGPMPNAALVLEVRAVLAASPFHGEGHR